MKSLYVGDLHFGVNENNEKYQKYFLKSIDWLINTIKEFKSETVVFAGDIFDNRKHITLKTIKTFQEQFLDRLNYEVIPENQDVCLYFIVGNHDAHYKDTLSVNSPHLLIPKSKNYIVIEEPFKNNHNQVFVPWVNVDNVDRVERFIAENSSAENTLFGHFEFSGFEMVKGINSAHDSVSRFIVKGYKKVYTGHYHLPNARGNIEYIGSFCQMDWNDCGSVKHVILEDSDKISYIKNPNRFFEKVAVNGVSDLSDIENFENKEVKLFLNCERSVAIEKALQKVIDCSAKAVIYDKEISVVSDNEELMENVGKMTVPEIWREYVNESYPQDAKGLDAVLTDIYKEIMMEA